jgi:5'-3' exonuclease
MCILSGCDYLDSPKGIGLKTAYFLLNKFSNAKTLIDNYDKELDPNYTEAFMCAYLAFRYSLVYCPYKKDLEYLEPFNPDYLGIEDSFDYLALSIAKSHMESFDFLG